MTEYKGYLDPASVLLSNHKTTELFNEDQEPIEKPFNIDYTTDDVITINVKTFKELLKTINKHSESISITAQEGKTLIKFNGAIITGEIKIMTENNIKEIRKEDSTVILSNNYLIKILEDILTLAKDRKDKDPIATITISTDRPALITYNDVFYILAPRIKND